MTHYPMQVEGKRKEDTTVGGRTVLTPKSPITHENCHEIERQIGEAVKRSKTDIILDCKHVIYLDSAALELLIRAHDELKNKGGALKIAGLNNVCRDTLMATRLINVLFVYKDIHEAVANAK